MVESAVFDHISKRPAGSGLWVRSTEHDRLEPSQDGGSRTHRAGLERHVKGASLEPPVVEGFGRSSNSDHLSVCRGIGQGARQIVTATDNLAPSQNRGSYGHFVTLQSRRGLLERDGHPKGVEIARHVRRFQ